MQIRIQAFPDEIQKFVEEIEKNPKIRVRSVSKDYENRDGREKRVYVNLDILN